MDDPPPEVSSPPTPTTTTDLVSLLPPKLSPKKLFYTHSSRLKSGKTLAPRVVLGNVKKPSSRSRILLPSVPESVVLSQELIGKEATEIASELQRNQLEKACKSASNEEKGAQKSLVQDAKDGGPPELELVQSSPEQRAKSDLSTLGQAQTIDADKPDMDGEKGE